VLVREDAAGWRGRDVATGASRLVLRIAADSGITNFPPPRDAARHEQATAVQLATSYEDIAATLDSAARSSRPRLRGQALARHWETLLGLIAEVALDATLPADEIEKDGRLLLGPDQGSRRRRRSP